MDKISFSIDTEAETSMEQDAEEKIYNKVSSNAMMQNVTNSLFNITFDDLDELKDDRGKFKDYEARLHQNMKDWKAVYYNAHKDLKKSKEKHPVIDKSVLSPEKRAYLDKAENLQHFIRESIQFRQQATKFLEYDYAEYIDMLKNLETLYEHRLNLIKARKIAEVLANANKKVD